MFVPEVDAPEAALIPDLEIYPVKTLADLYDHLSGRRLIEPYLPSSDSVEPLFIPTDFSEIKGQEHVKRALEVAAAGGQNVVMVDSPCTRRTFWSGNLLEIRIEESLALSRIYSVIDHCWSIYHGGCSWIDIRIWHMLPWSERQLGLQDQPRVGDAFVEDLR